MELKDIATGLFDSGFNTALARAIEILRKSQVMNGKDLQSEIVMLENLITITTPDYPKERNTKG
jgi:hypothetical protein